MDRHLKLVLFLSLASLGAPPALAQITKKAEQAASIESECSLKKGTITVSGEEIHLQPSPNEAYEHVDCAIEKLNKAGLGKLGFVGNEAAPNAVLRPPLRWVAIGSNAQIAALRKAAEADKWIIIRTASASDGTAFLQLESGPTMTHAQAGLVERIWKKEFGDLEFGYAPRKLSEPDPFDD